MVGRNIRIGLLILLQASKPSPSSTAANTREEQLALIDTLLNAWADTAEFGTLQSRAAEHGYSVNTNLGAAWQRRLTTLEVFNGRGFFKMPWDGASIVQTGLQGLSFGRNEYNPVTQRNVWNPKVVNATFWNAQLNPLDQAYTALRESVYQALLPQTRLKPYLDAISLTVDANGLQLDFAAVQTAFETQAASNPDKAVADLIEFNRYGKDTFAGTAWQTDGWQMLGDILRNASITPEIQKTLTDFNIGMDGHPVRDTGKDQVLIASDPSTSSGQVQGSALNGNWGNDVLVGGAGNDVLDASGGNDLLLGGGGDDTLNAGWGSDTLQGGTGNDVYVYNLGDGSATVWLRWRRGAANDALYLLERRVA